MNLESVDILNNKANKSNRPLKILTVSSANMDLIMQTEKIPAGGETYISGGSYSYVPGGKGANSALAFARLGGDSTFCTAIGNDSNGDKLLSLYEKEGIETSHILRLDDTPTGLAAIILEKSGENRIIVYPAANHKLTQDQVISAIDEENPDALFLQFEISREITLLAANEAAKRNVPVFMDAGPADPSFPYDKLLNITVFSPNETECEILTGIAPIDNDSSLLAAKKLSKMTNAEAVVIKLGGRGCYVYSEIGIDGKEQGELFPSYPIEKVDTTAAGDAFTAGLTLEYLRCGNIRRAARYANVVGALTVSKLGASASIPTCDDVEDFINDRGIDLDV